MKIISECSTDVIIFIAVHNMCETAEHGPAPQREGGGWGKSYKFIPSSFGFTYRTIR